jgi:hypothetical protein
VVRVFEVLPATSRGNNRYRTVAPSEPVDWTLWQFDGSKKAQRWYDRRPAVEFLNRRRPIAPFLPCTAPGSFALLQPIDSHLEQLISEVAEILPVPDVNGVEISIVNPFPSYSCIDLTLSDGPRFGDGSFMDIEHFVFDKDRLPERSLIRPAENWSTLLAVQGTVPDEKDFKALVERRYLPGLEFRELWNEELGPVQSRGVSDIWRTSPTTY